MSLRRGDRVRVNSRYGFYVLYPCVGVVAEPGPNDYNLVLFTEGVEREGLFSDEELDLA